jgi:hypothetical protein
VSSQSDPEKADVDLAAVHGEVSADPGVDHAAQLIAFTEAVMKRDSEAIARERDALCTLTSKETVVDTAAVISAFNVVDRIADSTGIPLDPFLEAISGEVREELKLARFGSSANTPGAS